MTLLLVRHAHAGERSAWTDDDRLRPLSDRGLRQASDIAARFAHLGPVRLLSSPALRCTQTLEPLAAEVGGTVEADDRLFEGLRDRDLDALLDDVRRRPDDTVAWCTHGDIIPALLDRMIAEGMRPADPLRWHKGGAWVIAHGAKGWSTGRYTRPES